MKKDYINSIPEAERRFFAELPEVRTENSRTIRGYAAVFDKNSVVISGSFIEKIERNAFDDVLNSDFVALFNHDQNQILARNKVTLRTGVDEKGLWYEFEAPNTTAGNDLLENIRLGNVQKSSFAFTVKEQRWEPPQGERKVSLRSIKKIDQLFDVSPVTYPAYPDTSVAQRSFEQIEFVNIENEKRKHEIFKLKQV